MKAKVVMAVLLAVLASGAWAQRQKSIIPELDDDGRRGEMARRAQEKAAERFLAADENGDGSISRDEMSRHSAYMAERFDQLDRNHDGVLSWQEFIGHDKWPAPERRPAAQQ